MKRISRAFAVVATTILAVLSMGAAGVNPNWFATAWCIDNANQSGCANDANDGHLCTCTGGGTHHGPLKTFSEFWQNRMGCTQSGQCSNVYQAINGLTSVKVTFLSADSGEPINVDLTTMGSFGGIVFTGNLAASQQVCTGTLSSFTARASGRSSGVTNSTASGLYKAAISGCTLAYGELVFDSTNPSYFWPYYDVTTNGGTPGSGDTWAFSQPLLGGYDAFASQGPAEVAITSGDSVTVYTPPTITPNKLHCTVYAGNGGNGPQRGCTWQTLTFGGNVANTVNANNGTALDRIALVSNFQITPGSNGQTYLMNVSAPKSAVDYSNPTGGFGGGQNYVLGGIYGIGSSGAQNTLTCSGCFLDGDVIFGQQPGTISSSISNFGGAVYIDTTGGILVYPGSAISFTGNLLGTTALWGPGSITSLANSTIGYAGGAGKAVATFLNIGGLVLSQAGVSVPGCILNTTSGTQTCNITPTAPHLDANLGATTGCLFAPGGESICN